MNSNYWNRGIDMVPHVTGAASVMDCSDLVDACKGLGVALPLTNVLDVGCGTGRWSKFCTGYLGVDISPDAVAYCRRTGVEAQFLITPNAMPEGPYDTICCFSVFTHIGTLGREDYLYAFATRSRRVLVDIIPGDGRGDIPLWTADPDQFRGSVHDAGYGVSATYTRTSPDEVRHHYYLLEKR